MWVNTNIFFCCSVLWISNLFAWGRQSIFSEIVVLSYCGLLGDQQVQPGGWSVCLFVFFPLCCEDQSSFYGAGMVYFQRLVFCPSVDYWVNSRCSQVVGHQSLDWYVGQTFMHSYIVSFNVYCYFKTLLTPTNAQFCTIYVFFSVISFMFQHFHHPQSLYTNISLKRTALCNLQ